MFDIILAVLFGCALGANAVRLYDTIREKRSFKDRPNNKVYPTKPWPPPPPPQGSPK